MLAPSLLALLGVLAAVVPARWPGATNQTATARFCDAPAARMPVLFAEVVSRPAIADRVLAASERFLGVPYVHDPLGEGAGQRPDPDPRLRYDAVDCTTFVETVIALARAGSAAEVPALLDQIRYDAGVVGYAERNHFFEAQWVPANERKGFIREITSTLGGARAVALTKVVTAADWRRRTMARGIELPTGRAPVGRFPVEYVPLDQVLAIGGAIPSGTLFAVVREDRARAPFMATHMGFVVQTPRGPVARHAGRQIYGQVVDEDLAHFVGRNARLGPWKVIGLRFFEVLEDPAKKKKPVAGAGP